MLSIGVFSKGFSKVLDQSDFSLKVMEAFPFEDRGNN